MLQCTICYICTVQPLCMRFLNFVFIGGKVEYVGRGQNVDKRQKTTRWDEDDEMGRRRHWRDVLMAAKTSLLVLLLHKEGKGRGSGREREGRRGGGAERREGEEGRFQGEGNGYSKPSNMTINTPNPACLASDARVRGKNKRATAGKDENSSTAVAGIVARNRGRHSS